jgi:hypothetical protein
LRLKPEKLDQISVRQMVQKVDAVNKWRAEEAAKAELEGMMGNLTAAARLEIPDAQLSFVKEPGMKWVDIPDTVGGEGMKLCTTIGKQAGWCTQGEGLAERYGSGENRLTTLLDAEGRPHAQAMLKVKANDQDTGDMYFRNMATLLAQRGIPNAEDVAMQIARGNKSSQSKKVRDMLPEISEEAKRMIPDDLQLAKPDIIELKPVGNAFNSERAREYAKRDPDYKNKITDSVLEFLKSGSWGDVKDLHHYDIIDAKNPSAVKTFIRDNYGGDFGMVDANSIQKEFMKNYNGERFIKAEQFGDLINDYVPKTDGYADGGRVRAGEGLPDPSLLNLTLYADTVSREMFPSARDNTKRDAARHMLASAIAAQKTNPTITGWLGKAHELKEAPFRTAGHWLGLSDPRADYPTDIHNNELGIQLGTDNRTLQDLIDSVEREANRGTPTTQKGRASLQPDPVTGTRYAQGGLVGTPVTAYDPFQVDQIMSSINAPQNYSHGGSVSAYDSSRVDAIVNQFM